MMMDTTEVCSANLNTTFGKEVACARVFPKYPKEKKATFILSSGSRAHFVTDSYTQWRRCIIVRSLEYPELQTATDSCSSSAAQRSAV